MFRRDLNGRPRRLSASGANVDFDRPITQISHSPLTPARTAAGDPHLARTVHEQPSSAVSTAPPYPHFFPSRDWPMSPNAAQSFSASASAPSTEASYPAPISPSSRASGIPSGTAQVTQNASSFPVNTRHRTATDYESLTLARFTTDKNELARAEPLLETPRGIQMKLTPMSDFVRIIAAAQVPTSAEVITNHDASHQPALRQSLNVAAASPDRDSSPLPHGAVHIAPSDGFDLGVVQAGHVSISADATHIAWTNSEMLPRLWTVNEYGRTATKPFASQHRAAYCVSSTDGTRLLTRDASHMRLLCTNTSEELYGQSVPSISDLRSVAMTPDGDKLVSVFYESSNNVSRSVINVVSWNTRIRTQWRGSISVRDCKISNDGTEIALLASMGRTHVLQKYILRPSGKFLSAQWQSSEAACMAMDGTGNVIAHVDNENMRVYREESNMQHRTVTMCGRTSNECNVYCALSMDGKRLASGLTSCEVGLWDAITGHLLAKLVGLSGRVSCCDISADGEKVVSSSDNGKIRLWRIQLDEGTFVQQREVLADAQEAEADIATNEMQRREEPQNDEGTTRREILEDDHNRQKAAEECGHNEVAKQECVIDMSPFLPGQRLVTLPCMHVFHEECVMPHLRGEYNPMCPIDRSPIRKEDLPLLPIWSLDE